ncbi:MAG: hypothetical protein QOH97_992, partial [Actinoplanes sp.]|nr:hypothetical protein [Actinoplanes sp.]
MTERSVAPRTGVGTATRPAAPGRLRV